MVRTFAFNPSTQSFGDTLPGIDVKPKQSNAQYILPPQVQHTPSHHYPSNYNPSNNPSHTISKSNFDSSFSYSISDTSNSTSELSPQAARRATRVMQPAMIVEDASDLFAVRSILINGQRFYQPVDMQLHDGLHTSLKRHLESGGCNGHNPLRHTSSAEHLDNSPAKAALVAMRIAEERNRQEMEQRGPSHGFRNVEENGRQQKFRNDFNEFFAADESKTNDIKKMGDELPWARGNPQPRSGKRGSPAWQLGQNNQQQHATPAPFLSDQHSYTPASQHRPLNLSNSYGSFYSDLSTHAAYRPAPNLAQFANTVEQKKKLEVEQHNYELQKQIEDNKRRKYLEKQREWEQEERERIRNEIYAQRQRAEVEAEQNRAIEKALTAERKAERIAAAQRVTMELISKQKQSDEPKKAHLAEHKRSLTPSPRFGDPVHDEPKLEWWEKKASWNERGKSPALPAMRYHKDEQNNNDENFLSNNADDNYPHSQIAVANRRRMDSASSRRSLSNHAVSPQNHDYDMAADYVLNRPESRPIHPAARAKSHSRNSRLSYQSSIEAAAPNNRPESRTRSSRRESRLENTHAKLSANQRDLEHENSRRRHAVQKDECGQNVYD